MKINLFIIFASFALIIAPRIVSSSTPAYVYDPYSGWTYLDKTCGSINNTAAQDGKCNYNDDSLQMQCAYEQCDPYKFYPNLSPTGAGTDCANFLSQCLIAGGLKLPGGGDGCAAASGDSGITMPLSMDIDNFLYAQKGSLVTEMKTLSSTSSIPVDLAAGDVIIFFDKPWLNFHSTMVQSASLNGEIFPVLGYHGGAGYSIYGGGCVCNATGSYTALFRAGGGKYDSCDWFHFGPTTQAQGCVGCTPPSTAPAPPNGLAAQQVSNGIQLSWPSTDFGHSSGIYKIYRRPSSTPNISYANCIVSLSTTSGIPKDPNSGWLLYTDTLACFNTGVAGVNYSYSIAASNLAGEGCNGPFASSCNWQSQGCSVCSVKEATATMPSAITIKNVTIPRCSVVDTIHGNPITILPNTTVYPNVKFVSP
jgi:hypothetical protein